MNSNFLLYVKAEGSGINIQQVEFLRKRLPAVLNNDRILSVLIERLKEVLEGTNGVKSLQVADKCLVFQQTIKI